MSLNIADNYQIELNLKLVYFMFHEYTFIYFSIIDFRPKYVG